MLAGKYMVEIIDTPMKKGHSQLPSLVADLTPRAYPFHRMIHMV